MADNAAMPSTHVIILSSGGLRSLVATALSLKDASKTRATLLHVVDGRDNTVVRLEHVRRHAEFFSIGRINELDMPHLFGHGHGLGPDNVPMGALVAPQMLTAALCHARFAQAQSVIWPASFNLDVQAMAKATEQMMLCDQQAQLEGVPMPKLEAPLLEMSDQQIMDLGGQLQVDWRLAWCCLMQADKPCRACPACRRRKAAFEEAGMLDPAEGRNSKLLIQN